MNQTTIKGAKAAAKPAAVIAPPTTIAAPYPFTKFQAVTAGDTVDLSPSLNAGGAALVLETTTSDWNEVVCIWTDGISFAPKAGSYSVFWFKQLPDFRRPSESDIRNFLSQEAGPPGTINLRPPPTPIPVEIPDSP